MDEPWNEPTAVTVEVCVRLRVAGRFHCVNDLESAIIEATQAGGRQLYVESFRRWQELWLEPRRDRCRAIRWRCIEQITPRGPVRHFPVHLGLHYTGRQRRFAKRGSTSVTLTDKTLWATVRALRLFGPALRRLLDGRCRAGASVVLSDGDEGLERLRERHFEESLWLVDRWHVSAAVREFVGHDAGEYRRLMEPLWRSDSEGVLRALAASRLRGQRPEAFRALFGYLLGNREGIENWKRLPAAWRRAEGRRPARVKSGSGAVEKHVEVSVNRRFGGKGAVGIPSEPSACCN